VLLALQKLELAVNASGKFIVEPGDAHGDKRARLLPNPDPLLQERRDVEKMARDVRDQVLLSAIQSALCFVLLPLPPPPTRSTVTLVHDQFMNAVKDKKALAEELAALRAGTATSRRLSGALLPASMGAIMSPASQVGAVRMCGLGQVGELEWVWGERAVWRRAAQAQLAC